MALCHPCCAFDSPEGPQRAASAGWCISCRLLSMALLGLGLLRSACSICRLCTREGQSQGGAADLQCKAQGFGVQQQEQSPVQRQPQAAVIKLTPYLPGAHLSREGLVCIEGRKEASQGPSRCVGHGIARE